jgi:hypothetical protein
MLQIVALIFKHLNGTTRSARLVFDSGSGAIILDESLANDLGLKPTGEAIADGGMRYLSTNSPVTHSGFYANACRREEEEATSMLDIILAFHHLDHDRIPNLGIGRGASAGPRCHVSAFSGP